MWSAGATARRSALTDQQRVLFLVADSTERTKRQLVRALKGGQCRGIALPDMADVSALRLVRNALETVYAGEKAIARKQFAIVATTPAACGAETLHHLVENALATMRTGQIDVLLLDARTLSLPPTQARSLFARKRVLLEYWAQMLLLREAGMVQHVGVSDFSIQDVELLVSSHPTDAPAVLAVNAGISQATTSASQHIAATTLSTYVAFAHGGGMDVLVQSAFSQLDDLPLAQRERWEQAWVGITQRHATSTFQHLVTHELDKCSEFHVETSAIKRHDTEITEQDGDEDGSHPLGSALLVVLRYFLQRGMAVIPMLHNVEPEENNGGDDVADMVFRDAIHPFAGLHPAFSPHKVFSSILTDDELNAVERALSFTVLGQQAGQSEDGQALS